jgi:RNA polymerase sigma-70 factor (ECF subfamily)
MSETTQKLVIEAKKGNAQALDALYRRCVERVHTIVRLRLGRELRSKLDSWDIVQTVLLASLRDLPQFEYKTEGDFLNWLSKIVENRIRDKIDYYHAARRDVAREQPLDAASLDSSTSGGSPALPDKHASTPSQNVRAREEMDRLEKALDALSPEHREVVILARYEGLSYQEIGEQLGKSPEAVRMLLARALSNLSRLADRGSTSDDRRV